MSDLIGRQIDNYEILSLLGEGGMASVYRARQTRMNRDVAIKVIEAKLARNPDFLLRFDREAKTVAGLSHPHILKVFDYGKYEDTVYLVMELLRGGSLAEQIRQGALPLDKASRILEQIASALDYAHRQGIIHRDLKPQNVLLDTEGNAHLTDFGIAKLLTETSALTQGGVAMGTPAYMSPEQWQGQSLDNRADIYALGIMLFEMLTGRLPYLADTPFSMMHMHINVPSPAIREFRTDLPPRVEAVIQKALSKTREGRFSTAGELASAFKAAIAGGAPVMLTNPQPLAPTVPTSGKPPQMEPTVTVTAASPAPARSGASLRSAVIVIAVVVALVLIGGSVLIIGGVLNKSTETPTLVSSAPSITPTTLIVALPTFTATLPPVQSTAPPQPTGGGQSLTPTPNITDTVQPQGNQTATAVLSTLPPATPLAVVAVNGQWTPVTQAIDGVAMVLVPPGCFQMGSHDAGNDEEPVNQQCFEAPFWIDQTEVTQGQFKQLGGVAGRSSAYSGEDRPVDSITWFEARDFCAKRGARLPTEAEWEYAARGPDALAYPWGNSFDVKNVVAGRDPVAGTVVVGSHPKGASWVGALDMSGNVWEWVSSIYQPYPYNKDDGRENDSDTTSKRVIRGGSWNITADNLFRASFRARNVPSLVVDNNGFRCVRSLAGTAVSVPPVPTPGPATAVPVVSKNKQWTPVTQNVDGVAMVLVPPGCFQMGSESGQDDEKPTSKQCFEAPFWIDQTEVTQGQFKQLGGVAAIPSTFEGNNLPVGDITWFEARDFCVKRGGRLPTEAEWEYAARGPDALIYPWGNTFDGERVIYNRVPNDGMAAAGTLPTGASWVGALDMSGNVWEWVSSIYQPYPYNKDDGREDDSDTTSERVLRGGSLFSSDIDSVSTSFRNWNKPSYDHSSYGFRCMRSA